MSAAISINAQQLAALKTLAGGIIPADERDAGAEAVQAGPRLAQKIESGINAAVYLQGLAAAQELAQELHHRELSALSAVEVHELIGKLRSQVPGFYKQLRMDVSAMYLSDPGVWERIGFPGPSTEKGGYADFDQPQTK